MFVEKELVGKRIQDIRLENNWTMKDFGEKINPSKPVTEGIISRWEKGVSIPSAKRLKKIADLGNITVEELLHGNKQTNLLNFFNQKWQEAKEDDFKTILGKNKQLTLDEDTKKQVYNAYMTFANASDIFDPLNLLKHFERAVKHIYHNQNKEGLLSQIREELIFLLTTHLKWSETIEGYDVDKYNKIVELTIPYLRALNEIADNDSSASNEILFDLWRRNIEEDDYQGFNEQYDEDYYTDPAYLDSLANSADVSLDEDDFLNPI